MATSYIEGYFLMLEDLSLETLEEFFILLTEVFINRERKEDQLLNPLFKILMDIYEERIIDWEILIERIMIVLCRKLNKVVIYLHISDDYFFLAPDIMANLGFFNLQIKTNDSKLYDKNCKLFLVLKPLPKSGYIIKKKELYLDMTVEKKLKTITNCITGLYMSYN